MCEILHGYNPLAMHQTMSTWGMICTPKEWKTPSSYSSVRHLQGKRYSTMLAGIPGPGFLIFRAVRVIEVPKTPLEAIAVATGISRKYLRISQSIYILSISQYREWCNHSRKKIVRTVASSTAHSSLCVGVVWEDTGSQPALTALQFACDSPESILVSVATETQHTWMGIWWARSLAISRDRAFYVIASYPESDVLTCSWYAEDDRG